ncbi:Nem1-Spo7 phosphatase regulatory subunit [Emydomyces testavorans]|uniref:Nem1-Spo7 phosphatase regulatory subunit n=1 Tax=Emydomyces testavorans TaxID=2070801 RepID=A0AAF0DEX9_9EURO|nr:Nem1-Spo7 phosphatase regulatory subunit [Emydomyces testavorans]
MSRLDQIVKGAPSPDAHLPDSLSRTPSPHLPVSSPGSPDAITASATPDPLATLPSSPPQIYLNLLILETSLRSQYLALRARRRQNTFFLLLLALWIAYFSYALFLRPREDGGVGGSPYWIVEMGEKIALMGGVVTGILVWGTGQWDRGVRWPRRWLGVANRGLRGINAKIVVIGGPWWKELLSYISFLFPFSDLFSAGPSFHYIERRHTGAHERHRRPTVTGRPSYDDDSDTGIEEDLSPGGDYIKLLLLPKSFSPAFRENWDEYRTEYWDRENERRARLREKVKHRERQLAKQEGRRLRWTGWQGWTRKRSFTKSSRDVEKPHHRAHHPLHHPQQHTHRHVHSRHSVDRDLKPPRLTESHSRTSSCSTTPNPLSDVDDKVTNSERERTRRRRSSSSTAASGSDRSRKSKSSLAGGGSTKRALTPLIQIESQDGSQDTSEAARSELLAA